jgi:hypothetical protein
VSGQTGQPGAASHSCCTCWHDTNLLNQPHRITSLTCKPAACCLPAIPPPLLAVCVNGGMVVMLWLCTRVWEHYKALKLEKRLQKKVKAVKKAE